MGASNGRPTIKTIAQIAGVSHVTVSQALRDFPHISKKTKKKIKRIADEIGYIPNVSAGSLSSKRASTIGIIVPSMDTETAYHIVFSAVSKAAVKEKLCVLVGTCDRDAELEKIFCRRMAENRIGALIVSPLTSDVDELKKICAGIVPIIFFGGKTGTEEDYYVTLDHYHSGQTAVEYLYDLGHRDIAFFEYAPENKTILQKRGGYEDAMRGRGLTPAVYREGDSADTMSAGKKLTECLIAAKKLPAAIWCASDLMAVGVLDALRQGGISVPGEVSVIGHDDLYISRLTPYSLTTFALPAEEMGIKAVELALAIMNRDDEDEPEIDPKGYLMKSELLVRGSTGSVKSSAG